MAGGATVTASNGVGLPVNSLDTTYTRAGSIIATATVVYNGITYIKTFTNDGLDITGESQWVAQP